MTTRLSEKDYSVYTSRLLHEWLLCLNVAGKTFFMLFSLDTLGLQSLAWLLLWKKGLFQTLVLSHSLLAIFSNYCLICYSGPSIGFSKIGLIVSFSVKLEISDADLSTLNLFYMPLVRRLSHNIFIFGSGFSYTAVYMCFFSL